jgi:hypothetical protein
LHAQAEGQLVLPHLHGLARRNGGKRRAGAREQAVFETATGYLVVFALLEDADPFQRVLIGCVKTSKQK